MAFGARKSKKKGGLMAARKQAAINAIAGVAEAAFLAAAADGELSDPEIEIISHLIYTLCDGDVTEEQVEGILEKCDDALASDGFQARMDNIAEKLPNDDARVAALYAVASVILGDDEYDPNNEGSFYDDFAELIGADEQAAADIWNETAENFGWS